MSTVASTVRSIPVAPDAKELENQVLSLFPTNKTFLTFEEIKKVLGYKSQTDVNALYRAINRLRDQRKLFFNFMYSIKQPNPKLFRKYGGMVLPSFMFLK